MVDQQGRFLLLRRSQGQRFLPGFWELPGGKVEPGETPTDAAARELHEETGITANLSGAWAHTYTYQSRSGKHTRQYDYIARLDRAQHVLLSAEHDQLQWVESIDGLPAGSVDPVLGRSLKRLLSYVQGTRMVVFEGLDAVGKSSVINELATALRSAGRSVVILDEFPSDFAGGYLPSLVVERQFLDLHPRIGTPVAQTLLIAGSHAYKLEIALWTAEPGAVILVDRSLVSVAAYQGVVLQEAGYAASEATEMLRTVTWMLPQPDIIVYLEREPHETLALRRARGDIVGGEADRFLDRVAEEYERVLASEERATVLRVAMTDREAADAAHEIWTKVASFIEVEAC